MSNNRSGLSTGLQSRLLTLLLLPLSIFAMVSAWFDYQSAGSAAIQQDQRLLRLVPLMVDSIVGLGQKPNEPPVILLAPAIEDFLKPRVGSAGYAVSDLQGNVLTGDIWLNSPTPTTFEPEFHSEISSGTTFRVVAQRAKTAAGEVVVQLADGSDPQQNWVQSLIFKILLPNLLLTIAAAFAVNFAIARALKPLIDLKDAVERRSPRDLSAIDTEKSPQEVQPLVNSLNRLFATVNAQSENQRRFVADAAHQLRTPLAALQAQVEAWAQLVTRKSAAERALTLPVDEKSTVFTEKNGDVSVKRSQFAIYLEADEILRLQSATRRTSQLAHQLLALSRADENSAAAQATSRVDLQTLCEEVLGQQLDAAMAKQIDLGMEAQPIAVQGYEWLLRELLANLVDNAIQYTPQGGRVTIRCGRAEQAFLEVEDNGPGIDAAEREKVLERFYRVAGTAAQGNGLGLAIAQEIARSHGASLQLQDANSAGGVARGLRITLVFPNGPYARIAASL